MTQHSKNSMLVAVAVIGLGILAATLLPMLASSPADDVHEIRLVVRDMNFYVEGESQPNPTLSVKAGEQVRLVLKNEDPGMQHDFVVKAWDSRHQDARGPRPGRHHHLPGPIEPGDRSTTARRTRS